MYVFSLHSTFLSSILDHFKPALLAMSGSININGVKDLPCFFWCFTTGFYYSYVII